MLYMHDGEKTSVDEHMQLGLKLIDLELLIYK